MEPAPAEAEWLCGGSVVLLVTAELEVLVVEVVVLVKPMPARPARPPPAPPSASASTYRSIVAGRVASSASTPCPSRDAGGRVPAASKTVRMRPA